MTRLRRPFVPLRGPAYRRFFTGQAFARTSVWVQSVAELWLVLKLTGSGVSLGLTTALQFAPMLLFGAWAGLLADRLSKRRILLFAQAWMILPAAALFALTATGAVELWMVYLLVLARGFGHAVDNPVRQAFLSEVVEPGLIPASVSLNAALVSTARMAGPAIGGALIAGAGVVPCFAVATVGFVIAFLALIALRPRNLAVSEPVPREPGQLRQGLRHIRSEPALLIPLAAMAVVGTLAFNFPVLLPLMARFEFHAGAGTFGALAAAMGIGAVIGSLLNAGRSRKPSLADLGLLAAVLRRVHRPAGGRPHPSAGLRRPGVRRRRVRGVRGHHQRAAPARRRPGPARPRDGDVQRGLPGLDARGRPDRGLGGRARGRAGRVRGRRRGHAANRSGHPVPGPGSGDGLAVLGPGAGHHLVGQVGRHLLVARQLHRELALARGDLPQVGRVGQQLGHRHLGLDLGHARLGLHAQRVAATAVEVADHVAHRVLGHRDRHLHDRLEQHRLGVLHRLLEGHRPGDLESHLRGVDRVV